LTQYSVISRIPYILYYKSVRSNGGKLLKFGISRIQYI